MEDTKPIWQDGSAVIFNVDGEINFVDGSEVVLVNYPNPKIIWIHSIHGGEG